MAITYGRLDLSPRKLVVKLKVNFQKLESTSSSRKPITLQINHMKLAELAKQFGDESMESSEEEPLQDDYSPLLRFRHNFDLKKQEIQLLSLNKRVMYRPRISDPQVFNKFLDRHPDCYIHFQGLYFYIDYPGTLEEFEEAIKQWTRLFTRIGRDCGWIDHVEVVWGKFWAENSVVNLLSLEKEVLEALASIEVERYVRILGAYDKAICASYLEEKMGVDNDGWIGFCWG